MEGLTTSLRTGFGFSVAAALACVGTAGVPSCRSIASTSQARPEPDIRRLVTGTALRALDADGRFRIDDRSTGSPFAVIGDSLAAELAVAFLRTFAWPDVVAVGIALGARLEQQHGGPIDVRRLTVSGPIVLARTPYEEVDTSAPAWLRNLGGPRLIVRLKQHSTTVASVGVAAYAVELRVVGGRVVLPHEAGNEFRANGNPADSGYLFPIGPERAVRAVAAATGALVTAVPTLFLPGHRFAYGFSRWRVTLDRPVAFVRYGTSDTVTSSAVYVGLRPPMTGRGRINDALLLQSHVQPQRDTIMLKPLYVLVRKSDIPITFDEVIAIRSANP